MLGGDYEEVFLLQIFRGSGELKKNVALLAGKSFFFLSSSSHIFKG